MITDKEANITSETIPGYGDQKITYSDIWLHVIQRAAIARINFSYREYFRAIDTLTTLLYKDERDKVKQFKQSQTKKDLFERYIELDEFILDLLNDKRFIGSKKDIKRGGE